MPRTFVAKIRKGERRDKRKPRFLRGLADPHPITARKDTKDDGICMCLEEKKKRMLNFC